MNNEHIIEEVRAIAHKAVDDILAVLSLGTDTVRLAQQRLAEVQQLVLEEDEPATTGRNLSDKNAHPNRGRPWKTEDDEQLLGKLAIGKPLQQIAIDMGRPVKGIKDRMRRLRKWGVL